jgi:hypothetical protein
MSPRQGAAFARKPTFFQTGAVVSDSRFCGVVVGDAMYAPGRAKMAAVSTILWRPLVQVATRDYRIVQKFAGYVVAWTWHVVRWERSFGSVFDLL